MNENNIISEVDVLIVAGGRCGSSTLKNTFINNGYKCIKVHDEKCFISQFKYDGLIDLIDRSSLNKQLYIIDSYRTPIERKISSFFSNISEYVPNYKDRSCKELINIFNTKYLNDIEECHFINVIMDKYGVEKFDTFDFKKKYVLKKKGNLVFIKILFSNIDEWDKIFSSILSKKIILYHDNLTENKEYYHIYKEFKEFYKTKKSYITDILNNDTEFKIYNTIEYQKKYINKYLLYSLNYNKFEEYFWSKNKKLLIDKWHHYLKIYDFHFKRFKNKNPKILEIGVYKGGSLEMWNSYFDGKCQIYGIDIDKECLKIPSILKTDNIQVDIGNQVKRKFWKKYIKDKPKFDIIIDDGGHRMQQQIITYEELIDHVSDDGIYLCEDLHTSYWGNYGGGLHKNNTFIEYTKKFIDMLHYYHIPTGNQFHKLNEKDKKIYKKFRQKIQSVHYYDSVIVLEINKDIDAPTNSKEK